MNGKIVTNKTQAWSAKLLGDQSHRDAGRVRRIYAQEFGRPQSGKQWAQASALSGSHRRTIEIAPCRPAELCRVIV